MRERGQGSGSSSLQWRVEERGVEGGTEKERVGISLLKPPSAASEVNPPGLERWLHDANRLYVRDATSACDTSG